MNRRKFLATLFGAGAAIAAGPALLALVPTPAAPPLPPPIFWDTAGALPLSLDEQLLLDRYIAPAAQALANAIDADLIGRRVSGDGVSLRSVLVNVFGQPHSLEGEAMGVKDSVKDIVTGLTTTGNKALGKDIVRAAQQQNREAMQGAVVGKVQEILVHIQKQKDYRAQTEKNIELLEQQIRAIEAGEFSVSVYGAITLNDEALRAGVVRMAECTNCGYSGRKSI